MMCMFDGFINNVEYMFQVIVINCVGELDFLVVFVFV